MTTTSSRSNCVYSLVLALILLGLVSASGATAEFSLADFRIVDRATYSKAPSRYERVRERHPVTGNEVYIERKPALRTLGSDIEAVIVGKAKIYGSGPKEREEMRRDLEAIIKAARKGEKEPQLTYPNGFSYKLTYKLKSLAWKKYVAFSRRNVDQFVYVKVENRDFGITLIGPVDDEFLQSREFTQYTTTDDANLIKEILSPIKDKVSWEP
jgi:hypothetical protein